MVGTTGAKSRIFALWRLARPRAAVLIATSPLVGFGYGHWEHALALRGGELLPLVIMSWLALHAGTMWFNAALDRDQGEVLFGEATRIPDDLARDAYLALATSVVLAGLADIGVGICATAGATLAVLYSHPRTRWKSHPVLGPAVNALGYGLLSPAAGWVLVDVPPSWRTLAVATLLMATALSVYFIGQVFQADEDRSRGDRTLVATHGPLAVVTATRLCLGYAGVGLVISCAVGWFPQACWIGCPALLLLDRWLVRTSATGRLDEAHTRGYVRRLVASGLLLLAAATASYLADLRADGPAAGQATRLH